MGVTMVYKPTCIWGGPSCGSRGFVKSRTKCVVIFFAGSCGSCQCHASKSNVLQVVVQACKSVRFSQQSISSIFSQAFCLFKISFCYYFVAKLRRFKIANQSWKNRRQNTQRKPTIPTTIQNLCFLCWNMLEPFTSHQCSNLGSACPRVPDAASPVSGAWYLSMLRPGLGFATVTYGEMIPQNLDGNLPEISGKTRNAHDSKPGGMGKASLPEQPRATQVRGRPYALFDKEIVGQFLLWNHWIPYNSV